MSTSIPYTSGIYKITCLPTGKIYIGSATNLYVRISLHRNQLARRYDTPHHNRYLQRAWDKYGADAFEFTVIELILEPFLHEREQYWLDKLQPYGKRGFNISKIAGSLRGVQWSDESRQKASKTHTGRKHAPMSEDQKRRLSEARKGRDLAGWTGRKHRPESIEKMRAAKIGKPEPLNAARAKVEAVAKTYIMTTPDGEELIIKNLQAFCREHGLSSSGFYRVLSGRYTHYRGWKCRFP